MKRDQLDQNRCLTSRWAVVHKSSLCARVMLMEAPSSHLSMFVQWS